MQDSEASPVRRNTDDAVSYRVNETPSHMKPVVVLGSLDSAR